MIIDIQSIFQVGQEPLTASKTLPSQDSSSIEKIVSSNAITNLNDDYQELCNNTDKLSTSNKPNKVGPPFVCTYCSRQYTERHRYEVHVRFHTGETPFKCPICNKGFRDNRKLKIHVRRHNSSLAHKCHLCPRSFEGKKGLEKHLIAHENNRCVETKIIKGVDGSISMALPEEKKRSVNDAVSIDVDINDIIENAGNKEAQITPLLAMMTPEPPPVENDPEEQATISLSVDDLMQYAQPMPRTAVKGHPELEERYADVTNNKILPVSMEEFASENLGKTQSGSKEHDASNNPHNDSGEFPDLLDCGSNLASISTQKFNLPSNSTPPQERIQDDTGLTFATLSGVKPEYPQSNDLNKESSTSLQSGEDSTKPKIVIAKKSSAPTPSPVLSQDSVDSTKTIAMNVGMTAPCDNGSTISTTTDQSATQSQISLPAGTCIVPAGISSATVSNVAAQQLSTDGSISVTSQQNVSQSPLTITLQYKVYSGEKDQHETVAVKRDLADLINEGPSKFGQSNIDTDSTQGDATTTVMPTTPSTAINEGVSQAPSYDPSNLPPLPVENNDADLVLKDTMKVKNSSGDTFDVPTVVTGGYCLDTMMCNICDKSFKNDKTLMGHMINHFGIAPKMAKCPICGLTLQKKSYARHLRLHGDIVPEVCRYCKKEFREKRSLDKHIKAIHSSDRPYNCNHCSECFKTANEQQRHIQSHMRDSFAHKCDKCQMTFQKQEELHTHQRTHLDQKTYVCDVCEKAFSSEKNMRAHAVKHQGELPHKCEICSMTFQSRSQLIRHATSHVKGKTEVVSPGASMGAPTISITQTQFSSNSSAGNISSSQTQVVSAKINTFLESFGAELENELGLDEFDSVEQSQENTISMNVSEVEIIPSEIESKIVNQIASNTEYTDDATMRLSMDLEDAAAEAAFAFGQHDLPEDILGGNEAESDNAIAGGSEDSGAASGTFGKAEPTKTLQCDICMAKLKNARSYIVHMKKHAGTISLRCRLCPEVFQGNMKLKRHMRTQHGPDTVNLNPIVMEEEDEEDSQSSTTSSTASNAKPVLNLAPKQSSATIANAVVPQSPVVVDLPRLPTGNFKTLY